MSRARCRHRDLTVWRYSGGGQAGVAKQRCVYCGAWLSLGKSNDDSEAVYREIKFAQATRDLTEDHLDEAAEIFLDAYDSAQPQNVARRPRTPMEILVDRACGIHDHQERDDG